MIYNHTEWIDAKRKGGAYRIVELDPNVCVTFEEVVDYNSDGSYLDYDPTFSKQDNAQNRGRRERLEDGYWCFVGIMATLWVEGVDIEGDSLFGVESDGGLEYFRDIEDDMLGVLKDYKFHVNQYLMKKTEELDALAKKLHSYSQTSGEVPQESVGGGQHG